MPMMDGSNINMSLHICVVGADTLLGMAIVTDLLHGSHRSTFKSVTALVSRQESIDDLTCIASSPKPTDSSVSHSTDSFQLKLQVLLLSDIIKFPSNHLALFQSIDGVCIIPPVIPDLIQVCSPIIHLCQMARVNNVVLLTPHHPESVCATFSPRLYEYRKIEHALKESDIAGHCILRYTFLQQYLLCWINKIGQDGILALPITDGMFAPIHITDVVASVVAIYVDRASHRPTMCPLHRASVYTLTGPALLTGTDLAQKFTEFISTSQPDPTPTTDSNHTPSLPSVVSFTSNSHNETKRFLMEKQNAIHNLAVDFDAVIETLDAIRHDADDMKILLNKMLKQIKNNTKSIHMDHDETQEIYLKEQGLVGNGVSSAVKILAGRDPLEIKEFIQECLASGCVAFKS
ncbi:hypothetical protein BATDEDRAFT_89003 [Batrachochytrium dendrobatidis JAM81]|uniref:NmrA-like domain-containing protein n=1 Tax=Batrachochytrium dendrobatidis (strain JAM81 / FGSC 10211) TaxID=684364 RepID=F4P3Y6_BATDJ|nr:uncharacterized protein BATDEDRAFT_89003 [Batrachochytrium dendrobatidis JAM81]EGF80302.1 hypothetical protein BATDEDRAFT_89003 [Batrachochytrium dendrobatidis JAM81]|eukprot:XP_006679235.1 hypothetical protein BATDEDRAFT_89003 [Batrachochytrium dendrobatidis JAM81]